MTRLTKSIREQIAKELLRSRFNERGEALVARSAELFSLVYESRYDPQTRQLMDKLRSKFKDAFQETAKISCRTSTGYSIDVGNTGFGEGDVRFFCRIASRPILAYDNNSSRWAFVDCEVGEKLQQFAADQGAFSKDIKAARVELMGALSIISTAKQLAEMWPEVMPRVGKFIPAPTAPNLPAVRFSNLTEAFGLGGAA